MSGKSTAEMKTAAGGANESKHALRVSGKVDGGLIQLGSASQVVVLLRNDDIKPLTVGEISLYPSSNISASVSQNQCSLEPVESGAVCALAINVKGLQAGKFRVEMLVKHDGRSRLITAHDLWSLARSTVDLERFVCEDVRTS